MTAAAVELVRRRPWQS